MKEQVHRIHWIDNAKGYGILLVIMGHLAVPAMMKKTMYSFHLPLFFLISGYVFNEKKYPFVTFLKRKIKTMVKPYFTLGLVLVLFTYLLMFLDGKSGLSDYFALFGKFLIQKRMWTLWFIASLFFLNLMFYPAKVHLTKRQLAFLTVVFPVLGLVYYRLGGNALPRNVDVCFMAFPFFYIGNLLKENGLLEKMASLPLHKKILLFILFVFLNLCTVYANLRFSGDTLEMFGSQYGIPLISYVSAFSGAFAVLCFSCMVDSAIVRYVGKNSLIYLALHQKIIIPVVHKILGFFSQDNSLVLLEGKYLMLLLFVVLTILLNTGIVVFIKNTRLRDFVY